MLEMKDRTPVLDFIATVATPRLKKNVDEQVPLVCMIYAITMNQPYTEDCHNYSGNWTQRKKKG